MKKPILLVDFDGVIHSYTSGWQGATIINDPPVEGALMWLWKATEWFDVMIYSSRSKEPGGIRAMCDWLQYYALEIWDREHPMCGSSEVFSFPKEKPAAFLTIDDRALTFNGDWSEFEPADLLNFKPWNKK